MHVACPPDNKLLRIDTLSRVYDETAIGAVGHMEGRENLVVLDHVEIFVNASCEGEVRVSVHKDDLLVSVAKIVYTLWLEHFM